MSPPGDDVKQRASELLIEFLSVSHVDSRQGLDELCSAHPEEASELRRQFEARMSLENELAIFGGLHAVQEDSSHTEGARIGDKIGDFKLLSRIASGGQGEVWEAEQLSLSRRVALKLVRHDRIQDKTFEIFAREARAGGRLSHPGIVAVHGFGEDDGRHWISQELVEGSRTLRNFIDEMRTRDALPPNYYRAVAVFVAELADALQAAHVAGVVHRDVKPQNVLVTRDNHPKLTDFGLARITDETAISMTGDIAGTWLYMSPEQIMAKPGDLDHRTDVFSLGVVFYEMMALARPFHGDTAQQIAEKIVFRDPPALQKIRSRVPRDLAVICGKALEKRKEDRFASMSEFAADLRRHMADKPILAWPPNLLEGASKWMRRNPAKSAVSALSIVALAVILGLGLRIWQQNEDLELERDRADDEAVVAREEALTSERLLDFMIGMFERQDVDRARGETITVKEVLDEQSRLIRNELQDDLELRARLMGTMGGVYQSLGLYPEAQPLLVEAARDLRATRGVEDLWTLQALRSLAGLYQEQGRYHEAEQVLLQILEGSRRLLGDESALVWTCWADLARCYDRQGRYAESLDHYERALAVQRRHLDEADPSLLSTIGGLAMLHNVMGRPQAAIALAQEVLDSRRRSLGEQDPDTVKALGNLAVLYSNNGQLQEAEALMSQVVEFMGGYLEEDHPYLLTAMDNLAVTRSQLGRLEGVEELQRRVLEGRTRALGTRHSDTNLARNNLAGHYLEIGKLDEAEWLLSEAADIGLEEWGPSDPLTLVILEKLAFVFRRQGRSEESERILLDILEGRRLSLGASHPETLRTLSDLAKHYQAVGRDADEARMWEEALRALAGVEDRTASGIAIRMRELVDFLQRAGREDEARALARELLDLTATDEPALTERH